MTIVKPERFQVGKRVSSILNDSIWVIDKVDLDKGELSVHDDFGFLCRLFLDNFDNHFYFLEALPVGINGVDTECKHDYTEYQGLRECFQFCTKCNCKKA